MLVANPCPNSGHFHLGPRPRPLPRRLPRHPHHGRILKVLSILKGEYDVIQRVIVSNGLQLENLAQARSTMERLWERLLQVRISHRYYMRFSDACSSSHSPPAAATG